MTSEHGTYRTSIVLDEETARRLTELAERTGENKTTLLRFLVRAGLMIVPEQWGIQVSWDEGQKQDPTQILDLASAAAKNVVLEVLERLFVEFRAQLAQKPPGSFR